MTTFADPAPATFADAPLTDPDPGSDVAAAAADRFATLVRGQPPAHVEDLLVAVQQALTRHDRIDLATVVHEALKSDGKPAMAVGYRELSTVSAPPVTKHYPGATRTELPEPLTLDHRFERVLRARGSRRDLGGPPVTLAELATVLRGSYGVRKIITAYNARQFPLRVIPTAGGLQSPELYVVINNVPGLAKGLYHYDAVGPRGDGAGHGLELLSRGNMRRAVVRAAPLQEWIHYADVVIVVTTVLDRLLWKYGPRCYRYAHMDIGYLSAHVYLVAAALSLRTSAVSGFEDEVMNRFLRVDGSREFVQLLMPIGRRPDGPAPVEGLGDKDGES